MKPMDSELSPSSCQPGMISSLQEFVGRENIHAATLTAIGALSGA
jgi:hypothetical protein